ncbi:P1 family peptidase, partial [Oscillochloris sp. ZM17-4]|uniref:P1 family peptidase n=1 Tax=Oscillochloris sp. ZM17-4 TaxID=2866714 RepID=UPI001C72EA05
LQVDGLPLGRALGRHYLREELDAGDADGSVIIVLATDAPLSDRNLARLARRGLAGLARTGAAMSDGSGDYALAFSVAEGVRRRQRREPPVAQVADLANAAMSPLFLAAIEAAEEAIYNALCAATTTAGFQGRAVEALPLEQIAALASSSPPRR